MAEVMLAFVLGWVCGLGTALAIGAWHGRRRIRAKRAALERIEREVWAQIQRYQTRAVRIEERPN